MLATNTYTSAIQFLFTDGRPIRPVDSSPKSQSDQLKADGKRVLVIDDEEDIADSLSEILKLHGYDAQPFHDGQSAIESARQQCPDIVISDVVMPVLNGVDTVIAIRELCPETHILLLSGQAATPGILQRADVSRDFELLSKPIHPYALLKRLSALGPKSS